MPQPVLVMGNVMSGIVLLLRACVIEALALVVSAVVCRLLQPETKNVRTKKISEAKSEKHSRRLAGRADRLI